MTLRADVATLSRSARAGFIDVETAREALALDGPRASRRLGELVDSGWLTRVRRGFYYVRPLGALPDRPIVPEDPWILAAIAFDPCYVGGWSAAEYWDLTEQIFADTFVVTARAVRSTHMRMLGLRFRLVRINSRERIESTEMVWRGEERVRTSGPERTVVDGLNNPAWLGGWRHLLDVLERYLERDKDRSQLAMELLAHGRGAAFKRLGYALERRFPHETTLVTTAAKHVTSGIVKLDPSLPLRGTIDARWGLRVNTVEEEQHPQ